jgi:hypothetical protein
MLNYAAFSALMILSGLLLHWLLMPRVCERVHLIPRRQVAGLRQKKRPGPRPSVDIRRELEEGVKKLRAHLVITLAVRVWRWAAGVVKSLVTWHARLRERRALPPCPDPWLQAAKPREVKRSGPVPSVDTRRKLEGGIEVLEAAHTHYAALEKALRKWKWKHHLRPRLETLRETIRQEPALVEALDRLHHRARAEGWTETEPALALAREVEALQARVGALASSRLGPPGRLDQLELSVIHTHPRLAPGEKIVFTGGFSPSLAGSGLLLLEVGLACFAANQMIRDAGETPSSWGWLWPVWLALAAVGFWRQYQRSGRFWLTEQRLIWLPTRGEPLQLPLRDIQSDGIRVCIPKGVRVHLKDGSTLHLDFLSQATRFADRLRYQLLLNHPPVR